MGNIYFCFLFAIFSFNLFFVNYKVIGINRSINNLPKSIFESSIPLIQETDYVKVYFDKDLLENKLTSYFDKNIKKFTDKYTVEYYYYYQKDESMCVSDECDAVKITLKADLFLFTRYTKSVKFYIQDNR